MSKIAIPKEAATVIILRPIAERRPSCFEVLMVQRHPDSIFVPECYVFPGGCIDDADCSDTTVSWCQGLDRQRAYQTLGDMPTPELALGAWVAAIRETFEETGLLLANINSDVSRLSEHRRMLLDGRINFLEIIRTEQWTLATDRLSYFAHWITPEFLPHRYDVRFFVAKAPENQEACSDGVELTGHVWITPQKALHEYEENRFDMVLPTIMTLRELSTFVTVEEVIRAAAQKHVPSILTSVAEKDGYLVEIMPDGTTSSPVL